MKKAFAFVLRFGSIAVALFALVFVACDREDPAATNEPLSENVRQHRSELDFDFEVELPNECIAGISEVDGMLAFEDWDTYLEVIECLRNTERQYNDDYLAAVDPEELYSIEQLDSLDSVYSFNEDAVLETFIAQFSGFDALFTKLKADETVWLDEIPDEADLDLTQSPYYDEPVVSSFEQALMNEQRQVQIGDSIYVTAPDGNIYQVHVYQRTSADQLAAGAHPGELVGPIVILTKTDTAGLGSGGDSDPNGQTCRDCRNFGRTTENEFSGSTRIQLRTGLKPIGANDFGLVVS